MVADSAFLVGTFVIAMMAGAIASISGFGIGSLITPLWSLRFGMKLAVAAVSIPHFIVTTYRLYLLRKHVDRRLLLSFGFMSAAGGLSGALIHFFLNSPLLALVFAALLIFTGVLGLSGLSNKLKFTGVTAWIAGFASGLLGGMVGNQGGIRSAAMLGFDVKREAFLATATAVGVIVDSARLPIYLVTQGSEISAMWPALIAASGGGLIGTALGNRILQSIPESHYRRVVSGMILLLGIAMLARSYWA